jgi:hypothetical protein
MPRQKLIIAVLLVAGVAHANPPYALTQPPVIESRQTVSAARAAATPPAAAEERPLGRPAQTATASPPSPTASSILSSNTLQSILALGGVVLLAVIAGSVLRSFAKRRGGLALSLGAGGRAPSGVLEVLGRYPVGGGVTLVLLKLDRRVLLLSQSSRALRGGGSAGFTTLCEINEPDEVASILAKTRDDEELAQNKRFTSMLRDQAQAMDTAERRAMIEPKPQAKPRSEATSEETADALIERLRGQIPVVDLTSRVSNSTAAERRDWQAQQTSIRQRLAAARESGGQSQRPRP